MRRMRAFSIIELLVLIGIIGILLSILIPVAERMRHRAYIQSCASNLRQIGVALAMYANDNRGNYPRGLYAPDQDWVAGKNHSSAGVFSDDPHAANDVTAAIFLLMRDQALPAKVFICPYDDVNAFVADAEDPYTHGNFTDYRKNLGYSFADMYPSQSATAKGYKWAASSAADFVLAADLNPGPGKEAPFDRLTAVTATSPNAVRERGNSPNHEQEGQNVLFGDGHVAYTTTSLCGAGQDNIYISKEGKIGGSPIDKEDTLLIPVDSDE